MMEPGGARSSRGLAEEQEQLLAMTCFALRKAFPSLNAFLNMSVLLIGRLSSPGEGECVSWIWLASGTIYPVHLG